MSTFQTLMALAVSIFALGALVQAVQEVLMAKTILWFGIFVLLALKVVQGQSANPSPPAADKKAADKKAADKKAADKKSTVKKAGPETPQGNPPAAEGSKAETATATPVVRLENARLDAADSDYANVSFRDCVPSQPDPTKIVCDGKDSKDFGDFQMLVVTLVAVVMYVMLVFHFLESVEFLKKATLPDVDSTILAGFGLGQGAYLAKKAGGKPGTS